MSAPNSVLVVESSYSNGSQSVSVRSVDFTDWYAPVSLPVDVPLGSNGWLFAFDRGQYYYVRYRADWSPEFYVKRDGEPERRLDVPGWPTYDWLSGRILQSEGSLAFSQWDQSSGICRAYLLKPSGGTVPVGDFPNCPDFRNLRIRAPIPPSPVPVGTI